MIQRMPCAQTQKSSKEKHILYLFMIVLTFRFLGIWMQWYLLMSISIDRLKVLSWNSLCKELHGIVQYILFVIDLCCVCRFCVMQNNHVWLFDFRKEIKTIFDRYTCDDPIEVNHYVWNNITSHKTICPRESIL